MESSFRLQKVLKYRNDMKSLANMELTRRVENLNCLREELAQLKNEEAALLRHYSIQEKMLDAGMIGLFHSYFAALQDSCAAKEEEIDCSRSGVEEQRGEVLQAWREHRKLECLKEHHGEKQWVGAKKQEQRINDEISVRMYGEAGASPLQGGATYR